MKELMKEINRIPLMTATEEKEIGRLAFQGDKKAQNKLVEANLRFAVKTAYKYVGQGLDIEDLVVIASEALMYAATKYNPDKGTKFISYAVWWIKDYLSKAICEEGQDVRLPVNRKDLIAKGNFKTASLDKVIGNDEDGACLGDLIEDRRNEAPEDYILRKCAKSDLKKILAKLPKNERNVIILRYGLDNGECRSLSTVGAMMGYSKERIRQIETRTLVKLRKACA